MNKKRPKVLRITYAISTCALIACALAHLCGCHKPKAEKLVHHFRSRPQMLREIQTLDLTPAKPDLQGRPPIDPNEPAPDELELTIERCRAMALQNNLDLKVQLIAPAIAAQRVTEEEARFEAALVSNFTYSKSDTPVASEIDLSGSSVDYAQTKPAEP